MIYFVQAGENGPIKIGKSSRNNFQSRMSQLQISNPEELILLGTISGGMNEEKRIHRHFDKFRIRGEWFEPSSVIKKFIRQRKQLKHTLVKNCDYIDIDQDGTCDLIRTVSKFGIKQACVKYGVTREHVYYRIRKFEKDVGIIFFAPHNYDRLTYQGREYLKAVD